MKFQISSEVIVLKHARFDIAKVLLGILGLAFPSMATVHPTLAATVLHSFDGKAGGGFPIGGLVMDAKGALYGTTSEGGAYGLGTVFRLTPPSSGTGPWIKTVLHHFNNVTGKHPYGGVTLNRKGELFGTTYGGGVYDLGTAFKLTPPASGVGVWTKTVLFYFTPSTASNPQAGLIMDSIGALYGATNMTVFKLTPPATGKGPWKFTNIGFAGSTYAGVTLDSKGALYGTNMNGGPYGAGTVFKLTPPASGVGPWTKTILYNFDNIGGKYLNSGVTLDASGALYGTASYGGVYDKGTVFKLSPPATGKGPWVRTVLQHLRPQTGYFPYLAGVTLDKSGVVYGTAYSGGRNGVGTVFKLTPPASGKGAWIMTVLNNFDQRVDGGRPMSGVIIDASGKLYGTTHAGGTNDSGTVFRIP